MKKVTLCLLILLLVMAICGVGCAERGSVEGIPQKVVDLLAEKGVQKDMIEDYINLDVVEAPKALAHLFVVATKDGFQHTVYHFTNSESDENAPSGWAYKTSYSGLAPQGKGTVGFWRHTVYDRYGADCNITLYKDANGFTIYRIDPNYEEDWSQEVSIHVINRQFQIVGWHDRKAADSVYAYIRNGKLYYEDADSGKKIGSIELHRTYELTAGFSSLPKTYKTAKQKITNPADIPAGELEAELIKFTSGKKYAVYSAPDDKSLRSANKKAAVSTNDWIQVFGEEDGWILIQYSIDSNHYRFGYISAKSLPKKTTVKELDFSRTDVTVQYDVCVTDDPLYSNPELIRLKSGEEVVLLATMGEWAYIEVNGQTKCRGFVPVSSVGADGNEGHYAVFVAKDGEQYNLFVIRKFLYGADHQVTAVSGDFERITWNGDYEEPETAPDSERTYVLAEDFYADMITSATADDLEYESVTDLYAWYTRANFDDNLTPGGELIFQVDEPERDDYNFWFITTQIELNDSGEIRYMQFVYTPWM